MKVKVVPALSSFIFTFFFLLLNACVWSENDNDTLTTILENETEIQYLPIDDSEYPYAGIPRVVIETENFREIRNKEIEVPAKLQIWGEKNPQSQVYNLSIRGRGNSSFHAMPKYSLQLTFPEKQEFFQMPQDKKWALISYFADKTLIRNYFINTLDSALGSEYTPRVHFVEVYLNRSYMGVYGFCETVKVSKDRINIPKDSSFLFEKTTHVDKQKKHVITQKGNEYEIKHPKEASSAAYKKLLLHLDSLEAIIYGKKFSNIETFSRWFNTEYFFRYYWLNEFSKNVDGKFIRSTYMSWEIGNPIKVTPVWDFDLTFGTNIDERSWVDPQGWLIKNSSIYHYIFSNQSIWQEAKRYWQNNKHIFLDELNQLDSIATILRQPAKNENKRWSTLNNNEFWAFKKKYKTYDEAVDSLKSWAKQRYQWIENNM